VIERANTPLLRGGHYHSDRRKDRTGGGALRIRVSVGKRGLFRGLVAWYGGEHVMRTHRITGTIHTNEAESD
jgi:hypothetical protein